jgi:hypothetical protein
MKLKSVLSVCLMAGLSVSFVRAQANADISFGVGTTSDAANKQGIDTFGTGTLFNSPSMHGGFGKVSGDLMLKPSFGVGAEYSFRFSQGAYAGLNYRPSFYDVNAIFAPKLHNSRIQPEFQAGLGGMRLSFYENQSGCDAFGGCSSTNSFVESSNHFQVHGLAGVRFYVTPKIFVRPEIDAHWVKNLFQFQSDFVPEYGVSVGYSFGRE